MHNFQTPRRQTREGPKRLSVEKVFYRSTRSYSARGWLVCWYMAGYHSLCIRSDVSINKSPVSRKRLGLLSAKQLHYLLNATYPYLLVPGTTVLYLLWTRSLFRTPFLQNDTTGYRSHNLLQRSNHQVALTRSPALSFYSGSIEPPLVAFWLRS